VTRAGGDIDVVIALEGAGNNFQHFALIEKRLIHEIGHESH
jgi:hypothetical protein